MSILKETATEFGVPIGAFSPVDSLPDNLILEETTGS